MIRRRSQKASKDVKRDDNAPAPFFNLATADAGPAEEAPLFNLEELHERRILSWSPEPDEFFDDDPRAEAEPTRSEREEAARSVYERPAPLEAEPEPVRASVEAPEAPAPVAAPQPVVPQPVARPVPAQPAVARPVEAPQPQPVRPAPVSQPVREVAPPAPVAPAPVEPVVPAVESEADEAAATPAAPKKRGRPRGRPRRQVHFHVDPDEERLLMAAVERYGSQQKGLIAALESLQESDMLRDEIDRLRAEVARHRRLLDEAESLFSR